VFQVIWSNFLTFTSRLHLYEYLVFAHRIPYPPNKGEKIRAFHQLLHLSKHHTVHLVCLIDDPNDLEHVSILERYCASVVAVYRSKTSALCLATRALLTCKPLSVAAFYRKALAREIARKLHTETFDVIFVSSAAMAEYVLEVSTLPRVVDFVDVDSEKWGQYAQHHAIPLAWIYGLEARRLAAYEAHIAQVFNHAVLISQEEKRLFQQRICDRPITVISNGVDLNYFAPKSAEAASHRQPTLVFTGAMDYFPNVDAVQYFCNDIFPLVRAVVPNCGFSIVGRHPTRHVQALRSHPNVTVTGAVPDVRPYLAQATIAVAPFRLARGVQNKVLEAMAAGLPVVGTSQAFEGIAATEEDGIRIADDPQRFAKELVTLLTGNDTLRQHCALRARRYVEAHHQWSEQGVQLERMLQGVVRPVGTDASLVAPHQ
jgi:sugar transferase (PEP-CTERM/EpsH1 system associated)